MRHQPARDSELPSFLHVERVRHLGRYRLAITFTDGTEREVEFEGELHGEVFGPLRDETAFAAAYVDAETRTVAWPNGADFAPEFLYQASREREPVPAGTR